MGDAFGRQALTEAWNQVFGDFPTLSEIQLAGAVARGESNYGQAPFKNLQTGESRILNNFGAVQCGARPPCPDGCFEATDHHADGTAYQGCFREYGSAAEGATHFLKVLCLQHNRDEDPTNVRAALASGNVDAVAHRMRASGYFEAPEEKYAAMIWNNVQAIAKNLGEPLAAFRGDPDEEGGSGGPLATSYSPVEPPSEPSGSQGSICDDDNYPYTD